MLNYLLPQRLWILRENTVLLTVIMHPAEIKCHSHSFKMELNLALSRVEDERSNSNSLKTKI